MNVKVQWIVLVDGEEIARFDRKRMAAVVAAAVGGIVSRYRKEWR